MVFMVIAANPAHLTSLRVQQALHARRPGQAPIVIRLEDAKEYLFRDREDVAVFVLSPEPERALDRLRGLRSYLKGPVLAVGPATDSKLILRALNEGADHFVDEAELGPSLEAVLARLESKHEAADTLKGRVLAVLGCGGGTGASTLAVNLACALAQKVSKCALIDLKPLMEDLAALLDLKPVHTLADLCRNADRLDRAMFQSALAPHPSGVSLLAAPRKLSEAGTVRPRGVSQALALAQQLFPFVVVDLEDYYHEEQLQALRQADSILLVFRPDFTSLRQARRIVDQLQQMDISRDRLLPVINRAGQGGEIAVAEIERALGMKMAALLPDDPKTINTANNAGIPAVLKAPSARVCQRITELAGRLGEASAADNVPDNRSRSRLMGGLLFSQK